MSMLTDARYDYGLVFSRFMPHNADNTISTPSRVVGGIGPFDFSDAVSSSAVTLKWKIDNATEASDTVDLSTASDINAVTVDELVSAVTTAAPTGLTASKETGTLRFKLAMTTPGTTKYFQVYGEIAQYSEIGQGLGAKFIKCETGQSDAEEPTMKADETKTVTDANGIDTDLIIPGYRKGAIYTFIDTAHDNELRQLIDGGVYNTTLGTYEEPTLETEKKTFLMEQFYAVYKKGSNKKADRVGYVRELIRTCMGSSKAGTRQNDWATYTYTITSTTYKNESGVFSGDKLSENLTVAQYEALAVTTV